jgi:hypothetical protein
VTENKTIWLLGASDPEMRAISKMLDLIEQPYHKTCLLHGWQRVKSSPALKGQQAKERKGKFMTYQTMWLLGASDPEMRGIEEFLKEVGQPYQWATKDGKPVHAGNAYQADPMIDLPDPLYQIVLVECEPVELPQVVGSPEHGAIIRIDHHRPGDPGYGLPPEQYWQGSSLGQAWDLTHNTDGCVTEGPTREQFILAAMDHCPGAAVRGECPYVSANEVLSRKVQEIAAGTEHSEEEVKDLIDYYGVQLAKAPTILIGEDVIDFRSHDLGSRYLELAAAQTAALSDGYTVLLRHHDRDGSEKWSISGHAMPQVIKAFMEKWAPAQGLTRIYGVPDRGYAGGYLAESM